ncbi:hypothetical protein Gotur_019597 [Gossypium turneri]
MYVDFAFTTGKFNGSSLSIFSRNPIGEIEREVAVIGGRGQFKMATGFADLVNLSLFVVSGCKNLRKIPKLLGAINLEDIECIGCESFVELPCLNHLASLGSLNLHKCRSLKEFPELLFLGDSMVKNGTEWRIETKNVAADLRPSCITQLIGLQRGCDIQLIKRDG